MKGRGTVAGVGRRGGKRVQRDASREKKRQTVRWGGGAPAQLCEALGEGLQPVVRKYQPSEGWSIACEGRGGVGGERGRGWRREGWRVRWRRGGMEGVEWE